MSDLECYRCATVIDGFEDDHYRLELEKRPIPDAEDMEFDEWFSKGVYLCSECVTDGLGIGLE